MAAETLTPQESYPKPARLNYPVEESRHSWLPMLLDIYHTTDIGVAEGINKEQRKGRELACFKGCSSCCRAHLDIPIFPIEITGLYWYVIEQSAGEVREKLRSQCKSHKPGEACPLLVDGACGVHPMRPQACRHFNVFGTPCAEGEDPFYTRRKDVLTPIKKYKDKAQDLMLPFHNVKGRNQRREAIKNGLLNGYVKVLQEIEWHKLADRMP